MSSGGGGGGQSGITRYDWNPTVGGYWEGLLKNGNDTRLESWQPYGRSSWLTPGSPDYNPNADPKSDLGASRVAGFDDGGPQDIYTAQQRVRDAANGFSIGANGERIPINPEVRDARIAAQQLSGGALTNPYAGDSPYFRQNLQAGLEDITNAYKKGTAADTAARFASAGVYGGGANQNAVANNEDALARNLSRTANEAYQQQYDRSANLSENVLNRQLSAIPLAYQAQSLTNDMNDRLMGIGTMNQGQRQKEMDDQYARWAEKQNFGRNNIDWFANLLGRAQGSTGVTSQTPAYAPTNYGSQALGLGLLGRGLGLY